MAGKPFGRCYFGCLGRVMEVDERTGLLKVSYDHQSMDPEGLQLGELVARQHAALEGFLSAQDLARKLRVPYPVVSMVGQGCYRRPPVALRGAALTCLDPKVGADVNNTLCRSRPPS